MKIRSYRILPSLFVSSSAETIPLLINGEATLGLVGWSTQYVSPSSDNVPGRSGSMCFASSGSPSTTSWMDQAANSTVYQTAVRQRRAVGVTLSAFFAIRSTVPSIPFIAIRLRSSDLSKRNIISSSTFQQSAILKTCSIFEDVRAHVYLGISSSAVYVDNVGMYAYIRPPVVFDANVADRQSAVFPECTWGTIDVTLTGSDDTFRIAPLGNVTAKQLFSVEALEASDPTRHGRVMVTVGFTAVAGPGAAPQLSVRQFSDDEVSVEVGSVLFTDGGTHSVRVLDAALWVEVGFRFSSSAARAVTGIAVQFSQNGTRTESASVFPSVSQSTIGSVSATTTSVLTVGSLSVSRTRSNAPTTTPTSSATWRRSTTATMSASFSVPYRTGSVSPAVTTPSSITTSSTVASSRSVSQSLMTASISSAPSHTARNRSCTASSSLTASVVPSPSFTVTRSWSRRAHRSATTTAELDSAPVAPRAVPAVTQATKETAVSGAVAVSVVSSAVGSVGGGAFALQRVAALASFCAPFDPDERPGVLEHPLRFAVGSGRARHSVGSAVGALLIFGAVVSAVVALAVGRGRLKTKRWMWRFRDLAPHTAAVRGTALLAAGYAITGPMVVGAAVEAAVQGDPAEAVFGCTAVLLVLSVPAVCMILLWHPVRAHASFSQGNASVGTRTAPAGQPQRVGDQNSEFVGIARVTTDDDDPLAFLNELDNDRDRPLWTDFHPRHPTVPSPEPVAARAPAAQAAVVAAWRWLWAPSGQWQSLGAGANGPTAPRPRGPLVLRALSGSGVALPVFGPLFTAYRAPWHWFLAAEAYAALAVAAVSAASAADVGWACVAAEAAAVALSVLLLVAVVVLRPYLAPGDALMAVVGSVLEALAAVLRVAGVEDTVVAAVLLALAAVAVLQLLGRTVRRIRVVIRRRLRPRPAPRPSGSDRPEGDTLVGPAEHGDQEMVAFDFNDDVSLFGFSFKSFDVPALDCDDPDGADPDVASAVAVPEAGETALDVFTDEGVVGDEHLLSYLELAMGSEGEAPVGDASPKPPSDGDPAAPRLPPAENKIMSGEDESPHPHTSRAVNKVRVEHDHAARAEELRRLLGDGFRAL